MRKLLVLAVVLLLASTFAFADQVVLSNGDRLTGTITQSDGDHLTLKTDYADQITINWSAIQEINSSQPLHVTNKDGKTVAGPVTTSNGNFVVQTSGGNVDVPKDQVTTLRSDEEQKTYEGTLRPPLSRGWSVGATAGFALTRGNSETKNLNLAFTGDRKTLHDETTLYLNSVYATNDAPLAFPTTTANTIQAGARYSHDIAKRIFAFGSADFQTDQLQTLDLRSIFTGGFGVHIIKTTKTTLDLDAGVNYTREHYSTGGPGNGPLIRNFPGLTLGEEFTQKLGLSTLLTEKAYVYPDIDPTGDYRLTFNVGSSTKLSKWLSWQNAFGDIYVNDPPDGKKRTDLLLTTGLNVTITH
ncbi:MAG TPA: DUF481 domain-containing protein [Terriglobales bacterium]|nr:DUF481 domain-containing protein [Terriglobales bacterium]